MNLLKHFDSIINALPSASRPLLSISSTWVLVFWNSGQKEPNGIDLSGLGRHTVCWWLGSWLSYLLCLCQSMFCLKCCYFLSSPVHCNIQSVSFRLAARICLSPALLTRCSAFILTYIRSACFKVNAAKRDMTADINKEEWEWQRDRSEIKGQKLNCTRREIDLKRSNNCRSLLLAALLVSWAVRTSSVMIDLNRSDEPKPCCQLAVADGGQKHSCCTGDHLRQSLAASIKKKKFFIIKIITGQQWSDLTFRVM